MKPLKITTHTFKFTTEELDRHIIASPCRFCTAPANAPCKVKARTALFNTSTNAFHMIRVGDGHQRMDHAHRA